MKNGLIISVTVLCVALISVSAQAVSLSFGLDTRYTGDLEPEGTIPWLTATFTDDNQPDNSVLLTMEAGNLVGSEFVSQWYFNMDDTLVTDPFLVFTPVSGTTAPPSFGLNDKDAAGDDGAGFDILFSFDRGNGDGLGPGETSVYLIELTSDSVLNLNAESFNFTNEAGDFYSVANVRGIDPSVDDSGWIAATTTNDIPEAASILTLGLGILGIGLVVRKRRLR
jgi:hypothetical protein